MIERIFAEPEGYTLGLLCGVPAGFIIGFIVGSWRRG